MRLLCRYLSFFLIPTSDYPTPLGYLYDCIWDTLNGLVDRAKDALGIFSPSRVMAKEVGAFIPAGIGVGIETIWSALERLVLI